MKGAPANPVAESKQSLWLLIVPPIIWSVHFMLCYVTAAIWCAKYAGPDRSLGIVRLAIAVYTLLAVAGLSSTGWMGYKKHRYGNSTLPHDADSPEDRHRFLGFATLLLSLLSLVATLFGALVVVFFWKCD